MAKKIFSFFYNIDTFQISDVDGNTLPDSAFPQTFLKQQDLVLAIDFVRNGGAVVTDLFLSNDVFGFAAAEDFDVGTPLLMQTSDSGFNVIGDRPDLDVPNGKISVQLDADSAPLAAFLGTTQTQTLEAEIQLFAAAATNPKGVFQFKLKARNLVDNAGAGPAPAPVGSFYTKIEADAIHAGLEEEEGSPITNQDATVLAILNVFTILAATRHVAQTGTIITTSITGSAGLPSFQWKTDTGIILSPVQAMIASEAVDDGQMRFTFNNDKVLPAGTIVQLEITTAGTSTTHVIDVLYQGDET